MITGPPSIDSLSAIAKTKDLKLKWVRGLELAGKPKFVAAASGMVRAGNFFWIAPDDEHFVASFPVSGGPGKTLRTFAGELPSDPKERKAVKPDIEALLLLPKSVTGLPHDLLTAIGSGSKPNRYRGVAVPLKQTGEAGGPVQEVDWTPLFAVLAAQFPKLNIEGACVVGDRLRLGQRGNGKDNVSAIVDLDLAAVVQAIRSGQAIPPSALRNIQRFDLGTVHDTPWTITDLAVLEDGRMVFTAAAEMSRGVVDDGKIVGSAVGVMEADGTVSVFHQTDPTVKCEGIHIVSSDNGSAELLLVTDADDPTKPADMYRVRLPLA